MDISDFGIKLDEVLVQTGGSWNSWVGENYEDVIRQLNYVPKMHLVRDMIEIEHFVRELSPGTKVGIITDPNFDLDVDTLTELATAHRFQVVLLNQN